MRREPQAKGLVSATRGNHGQSLAFAGRRFGLSVTIVAPHGNSSEKNAAMRALGAELIEHGQDFQAAREQAMRLADARGLHAVPSFHRDLALGVSTYALELLSEHADLDLLYVPIGQGSGICGCISARDALGLRTEIVGVQSAAAPAYALSLPPATSCRPRAPTLLPTAWRRGSPMRRLSTLSPKALPASRSFVTMRSPQRSAPTGPTRTISPRALARRRLRRR